MPFCSTSMSVFGNVYIYIHLYMNNSIYIYIYMYMYTLCCIELGAFLLDAFE